MYGYGQPQILVLSQNTKRECGRKVQLDNIKAAKAVADVVRTCLGPRAMLKMLMNPMGSIVMTSDGNAILREITVQHPAAKSMIEISRTQDEEVGDGTTSVIVLAGEILRLCQPLLEQEMHPTVIIKGLRNALKDADEALDTTASFAVNEQEDEVVLSVLRSCLGTKVFGRLGDFACNLALNAARIVHDKENNRNEVDIKRYVRIEKVPGGSVEDSRVLRGVMLNKDVVHGKMARYIEKPRVLLLDCNLEYKKGESQTEIEVSNETDFTALLKLEEQYIEQICADIISFKPDLLITEKGVSDLAQHYLMKAGISVLRRVKKTDNNRIARACGATIVNRTDEIRESDIGTRAQLFEVIKIGDDYFSFLECENPKACTIMLRGPSKDMLNEIERNLHDALFVARNILLKPNVVPGGGCIEMIVSSILKNKAKEITDESKLPYNILSAALEVIPQTLIQNCGGNTIRTLTALRAKHTKSSQKVLGNLKEYLEANNEPLWAINGETGEISDNAHLKIWEPLVVKQQAYKTAIETAILMLRVDDIISGSKKRDQLEKDEKNRKNMNAPVTEESMRED